MQLRIERRMVPHVPWGLLCSVLAVAGLGIELASLPVFAAWAIGGPFAVAVVVLAVVPLVAAGLRLPARVRD